MPNDPSTKSVRVWPQIRRILLLTGRDRWLFRAALAVGLLEALLTVCYPVFLRGMLDCALAGQRAPFFANLAPFLTSLLALTPVASLAAYLAGAFAERSQTRLRQALAERLAAIPLTKLQSRHSGDLMSLLTNDINALRTLTSGDLLNLIGQVASFILSVAYLFWANWQLTLATLAAAPLTILLMNRVISPLAGRAAEVQAETAKVSSVAQDALAGLPVVRAYGLESAQDERLRQANDSVLARVRQTVRLRAAADSLSSLIGIAPFLLAFGFGGYLALTGRMSAGSLLVFISLTNNISTPLALGPRLFANLAVAAGGAVRVFAVLDEPAERTDGQSDIPVTDAPVVRISGVEFSYSDGAPVFSGLELTLRAGETVALVGPSGCGKTTLLRLLLGFLTPTNGTIELFGRGLSDWNLSAVRGLCAVVGQENYLFPVSLGENIGYGRAGASQTEIEQAAESANAAGFISDLPEGYATPAGERGARLSGGQRQRIALARAILKDAPLLLLDEATAALDTESEAAVQEALDHARRGRTTLIIAHRLSTVRSADRILVIGNGCICEEGTHESLLARGGEYSHLYLKQFAASHEQQTAVAGGDA